MQALIKTALCILASMVLYIGLFGFVARKPIAIGVMHELYQSKIDYARSISEPKIVISAGSSGLYGIRCELIERTYGLPCANMAINKEMGMLGILEFARRAAVPGDLVLLPLEYGVYSGGGYGSTLRQYAIAYDRELLREMPIERKIWSAFYFDLRWLFASLAEVWSYRVQGVRHPLQEPGVLTPQGDLRGHTPEKGARFFDNLHEQDPGTTYMDGITYDSKALPMLREFLRWAARNDIRVVGALPPALDTGPLDQSALRVIRETYRNAGQQFIELENNGLYPIHCFYDTPNHLNEPCQAAHTRRLASALEPYMPQGSPGSLHARLRGEAVGWP